MEKEQFHLRKGKIYLGKWKIYLRKEKFHLGKGKLYLGKEKFDLRKEKIYLGKTKFHLGKEKIYLGKIIFPKLQTGVFEAKTEKNSIFALFTPGSVQKTDSLSRHKVGVGVEPHHFAQLFPKLGLGIGQQLV